VIKNTSILNKNVTGCQINHREIHPVGDKLSNLHW